MCMYKICTTCQHGIQKGQKKASETLKMALSFPVDAGN